MFQVMLLSWGICYPKMHCLMWLECLRMAVAMGIQCAWSGPVAWPRYEITGKRRWRCGSAEHLRKLTFFGMQYVQRIMYVWLRMYNYVLKIFLSVIVFDYVCMIAYVWLRMYNYVCKIFDVWLCMIMYVSSCMYGCVCIIMCVRFFVFDYERLCLYGHVCMTAYV